MIQGVHVEDLAELFVIVFRKLTSADQTQIPANPYERYVIANAEDTTLIELVTALAKILHKLGKIEQSEPVHVKKEDVQGMMGIMLGISTKCRTGRAYTLGWEPHRGTLAQTLEEDVEVTLKES